MFQVLPLFWWIATGATRYKHREALSHQEMPAAERLVAGGFRPIFSPLLSTMTSGSGRLLEMSFCISLLPKEQK